MPPCFMSACAGAVKWLHSFVKVVCLLNAVNFINASFSLLARFWARTQFCSLALAVYEEVREREASGGRRGKTERRVAG